jgi:flagellar protein FlaG
MNTIPINGLNFPEPQKSSSTRRSEKPQTEPAMPDQQAVQKPQIDTTSLSETSEYAATQNQPEEPSLQERVSEIVREMNEQIQQHSTQLEFVIDGDTNDVIVKIVNKESGELVRQIPPEELVNLTKAFSELRGVLFSQFS